MLSDLTWGATELTDRPAFPSGAPNPNPDPGDGSEAQGPSERAVSRAGGAQAAQQSRRSDCAGTEAGAAAGGGRNDGVEVASEEDGHLRAGRADAGASWPSWGSGCTAERAWS